MNRMYSPSPTVRSSPIPLYMRGWPPVEFLGQDGGIDTTMIDFGGDLIPPTFDTGGISMPFLPQPSDLNLEPSMFDPGSSLVFSSDPLALPQESLDRNARDLANMYAGAVASGAITPSSAAAQAAKAASELAKAAGGPGPFIFSPSPKVATRPPGATAPGASVFSSQKLISGVPDVALIGGGLLLLLAAVKR